MAHSAAFPLTRGAFSSWRSSASALPPTESSVWRPSRTVDFRLRDHHAVLRLAARSSGYIGTMKNVRLRDTWVLGKHELARLGIIYVAFSASWFVVGWLLTHALKHSFIVNTDESIARWWVKQRTTRLNSLSFVGSMLSDTVVKILVTAVVAIVILIVWKRWLEPLVGQHRTHETERVEPSRALLHPPASDGFVGVHDERMLQRMGQQPSDYEPCRAERDVDDSEPGQLVFAEYPCVAKTDVFHGADVPGRARCQTEDGMRITEPEVDGE